MGTSYGTVCNNCGHKEEYMLGFGFMGNPSFEFVRSSIKSKVLERHLGILESKYNGSIANTPSLEMYECPTCNTLHSKLLFQVNYGDSKVFEPQYTCGKCKSILIQVKLTGDYIGDDVSPLDYKCKKCGMKTLERSLSTILWD